MGLEHDYFELKDIMDEYFPDEVSAEMVSFVEVLSKAVAEGLEWNSCNCNGKILNLSATNRKFLPEPGQSSPQMGFVRVLENLEAYDFRDPQGHPLKNCEDFQMLRRLYEGCKEIHRIQERDPASTSEHYMRGMFNGMEILMTILDSREPWFKNPPPNPELDRQIKTEPPLVSGGNLSEYPG